MNALAADSISSLIAPPIRALAVAATGGGPRTRSERQRAALSPIAEDALVVALPRAPASWRRTGIVATRASPAGAQGLRLTLFNCQAKNGNSLAIAENAPHRVSAQP